MEKPRKPVPDVECLKYHGTPEKPDIKIFVSHRIDLDSATIDNPLYIPVRCGAVYDKREGITMLGDDTGDNISEKRGSFCELTVQYWAWKNIEADYFGLCHYRRYLSFSGDDKPELWQRMGGIDSMTTANLQDCGLLDEKSMRESIAAHDMVIAHEFDVRKVDTIRGVGYRNVYDYWSKGWEYHFVVREHLDFMLRSISRLYPGYYADANAYLSGKVFLGFNCYIMRRELFKKLCKFEFDILFDLEKEQELFSHPSTTQKRVCAYLSEILYSIWVYHEKKNTHLKVLETQLLFFMDPTLLHRISPFFKDNPRAITVIYTIDDMLSHPELDVSIYSLIANSSSQNCYDIIILVHGDGPDESWAKRNYVLWTHRINRLAADRKNVSIRIVDPKEYLGILSIHPFGTVYNQHKCYCPMLPWILEEFKKVLVLSSFSIVNCDVSELFFSTLENKCIGAAKDIFFQGILNGYDLRRMPQAKAVGMMNPYEYIDTNVMIMDLEDMRNLKDLNATLRLLRDFGFHKSTSDFLNIEYENHVKFLPYDWNFVLPQDAGASTCWQFAGAEESAKYRAVMSPKIVTYPAIPDPWKNSNLSDQIEFWNYARHVEVYEIILQNMMQLSYSSKPSYIWRVIDRTLPKGSKQRRIVKRILPKGSRRWNCCKKIYYTVFKR